MRSLTEFRTTGPLDLIEKPKKSRYLQRKKQKKVDILEEKQKKVYISIEYTRDQFLFFFFLKNPLFLGSVDIFLRVRSQNFFEASIFLTWNLKKHLTPSKFPQSSMKICIELMIV